MRIVSFVPSWTETFISAQIEVVGRTRFCIHPDNAISSISVVGGTKNISIDKVIALKPDLVIFDKEENNQEMYQLCVDRGLNCYATHVVDLKSCGQELLKLGELLKSKALKKWGMDYLNLKKIDRLKLHQCVQDGVLKNSDRYSYVIWKNPFMRVSPDTFIGDVLRLFDINLESSDQKYPKISEEELKKTFCLFSSEPFPFAKDFAELQSLGFNGVLIDGEQMSWYGIRTLKFLQSLEQS